MPELPEVETMRRVTEAQIAGKRAVDVQVLDEKIVAHPDVPVFCASLSGQTVSHVTRRGKFLAIVLASGDRLVMHCKMTGVLLIVPQGEALGRHVRMALRFQDGSRLCFEDMRRFGLCWFVGAGEKDDFSGISRLGLEPDDPQLNAEYLHDRLGASRRTIKACLMDQRVVAGIGNIYSDEILFSARIHPAREARTLDAAEWERLARLMPERIAWFTEKNAVTPEEYSMARGRDYRNTPYLQVYGHGGQPCPCCGNALIKRAISGRGSVFCSCCQREESVFRQVEGEKS